LTEKLILILTKHQAEYIFDKMVCFEVDGEQTATLIKDKVWNTLHTGVQKCRPRLKQIKKG